MTHDVFISYSSIDKGAADAVCATLEEKGISCWMAPRNITPGMPFAEAIIDGIKSSRVFVLVYSSHSNNSTQVIREVDRAVHNGLSIINLRLEDIPLSKQLEYYVSSVHWLDAMSPPLEKHIQQLCSVVQMFLKPEEVKDAEIAEALRKGILKQNEPSGISKGSHITKRRTILISGILLIVFFAILSLIVFNIGGIKQVKAGPIESIVILPFKNYTGSDTLDPIVSGMHYALINELSKIEGLRVISQISSESYKNSDKTVPQIAKELNVDAVIETGLLCFGDTICMQSRLMSGSHEEKQLWVGDHRESKGNLFNLYNQIIRQIAGEVRISLTPAEEAMLAESRNIDPEAIEAYLQGYFYGGGLDLTRESLFKARDYFQSAIEKEPGWASVYSGLAQVWMTIQQLGYEPPSVCTPIIYENLNKALELDPDHLSEAHFLKAMIAHLMEWDWEKSEKEFLSALSANPNDAKSRMLYGQLLCVLQRPDEAFTQGQLAMSLDPLNPVMKWWYTAILLGIGDCKTPLTIAEEVTAVDPGNFMFNTIILFAAYQCRQYDKVIEAERYYFPNIIPVDEDFFKEIDRIYSEHGIVSAYEEIMKHMEAFAQNNYIQFLEMAFRYVYANQLDKAMDWIEKGYEMDDPQMTYITTRMYNLDPLFMNPRFIAICEKMNLPLPKAD